MEKDADGRNQHFFLIIKIFPDSVGTRQGLASGVSTD